MWALIIVAIVFIIAMLSLTSPSENYRVKDRAYSSCDLPPDCHQKVERIAETNLGISNPFEWPYSGSASPELAVPAYAPTGRIIYPDSVTVYASDTVYSGSVPDHAIMS